MLHYVVSLQLQNLTGTYFPHFVLSSTPCTPFFTLKLISNDSQMLALKHLITGGTYSFTGKLENSNKSSNSIMNDSVSVLFPSYLLINLFMCLTFPPLKSFLISSLVIDRGTSSLPCCCSGNVCPHFLPVYRLHL